MSQPQAGETYDITLDPEKEGGVDRISLVKSPAIRRAFVALSDAVDEVVKLPIKVTLKDEVKRVVTGPVLIPDQKILRLNEAGEPYYIRFSGDMIERICRKFMKEQRTNATNQDHDPKTNATDNYLFETWLVLDSEKDKSAALGLESLPAQTWMASYKIEQEELWQRVEAGEVLGFSLEGVFEYEAPKPVEADTALPPTPQSTTKMAKATPTRRRNRMHAAWKKIRSVKSLLALVPGMTEFLAATRELLSDYVLEDGTGIRVDDETLAVMILDEEGNATVPAPDGNHTLGGEFAGIVIEVVDGKLTKPIDEIEASDSAPAASPIEQTSTQSELAAALERIAALEAKLAPPPAIEPPTPSEQATDKVAQLEAQLAEVKAQNEKLAKQPAAPPIEKEASTQPAGKEDKADYYFNLAKKLKAAAQ